MLTVPCLEEVDRCSSKMQGTLRICQLSPQTRYGDTSWAVSKCNLGCEVHALAYYHPKDVFVLGTSERSEFKLPEDDYHWEWNKECKS